MDEEKLKKYVGYAGLGFLPYYIYGLLQFRDLFWIFKYVKVLIIEDFNMGSLIFLIFLFTFAPLGGIVGGNKTKKWWGASLGGTIGVALAYLLWLMYVIIFLIG